MDGEFVIVYRRSLMPVYMNTHLDNKVGDRILSEKTVRARISSTKKKTVRAQISRIMMWPLLYRTKF